LAECAVLLVEDEEVFGELIARQLRAHGFPTVRVATGADASRVLADGLRPGVVLLDLNLPDQSGWTLMRGPLRPGVDRPPVVVVSALTIPPRRLREFGVAGYLPKPFAPATLLDLVERMLGNGESC
jgi:DNA-binding response OmpR family regulator